MKIRTEGPTHVAGLMVLLASSQDSTITAAYSLPLKTWFGSAVVESTLVKLAEPERFAAKILGPLQFRANPQLQEAA